MKKEKRKTYNIKTENEKIKICLNCDRKTCTYGTCEKMQKGKSEG